MAAFLDALSDAELATMDYVDGRAAAAIKRALSQVVIGHGREDIIFDPEGQAKINGRSEVLQIFESCLAVLHHSPNEVLRLTSASSKLQKSVVDR